MAEVNVNINGGGNLDDKLSKIREKIKGINDDANRLPTQKKIDIRQTVSQHYEQEKAYVRKKYEEKNIKTDEYLKKTEADFKSGKINRDEYINKKTAGFSEKFTNQDKQEEEIKNIDKESLKVLRMMLRETTEQNRLKREAEKRDILNQQDSSRKGFFGKIFGKNEKDEAIIDKTSAATKTIRGVGQVGGALGSSEIAGGAAGLAGIAGLGAIGAGVAVIVGAAAAVKASFDLQQHLQTLNATRAIGGGGVGGLKTIAGELISRSGSMSNLAIGFEELLGRAGEVQKTTRRGGKNLLGTAQETFALEKGYGLENPQQFMTLDRQFKTTDQFQKTSNDIAIEVLNTLTQIEQSSLKKHDLTTLGEKMEIAGKLNTQQLSYSNEIDTDKTLRLMAAAETAGVSKMGINQGTFYEKLQQGSKAGGGSGMRDLMMNQFATQFDRSLANDPLALREFVETGGGAKSIQFQAFLIEKINSIQNKIHAGMTQRAIFGLGGEDWTTFHMLSNLGANQGAMNIMKGGQIPAGMEFSKQKAADEASKVNISKLDQWGQTFSNGLSTLSTILQTAILDDGSINVNVRQTQIAAQHNTTKTGKSNVNGDKLRSDAIIAARKK